MKLRISLLCIAASVLVAVAVWRAQKAPASRPSSIASTPVVDPRVDRLEAEFRALRALLFQQSAAARAESSAPLVMPEHVDVLEAEAPRPETSSAEERNRRLREATLSTFDAALASEVRDAAWERSALRAWSEVLSTAELEKSRLQDVTCAQSLCRVVVKHQDAEARGKFVDAETRWLSPISGEVYMRYSRATNETLLFVAPDGARLPSVEAPAG